MPNEGSIVTLSWWVWEDSEESLMRTFSRMLDTLQAALQALPS
jgi:hypothetical protein